VDLPIENDDVWDSLSSFQQFLWYADEMEHRWHTLQQMFAGNHENNVPNFIEVTWNNRQELQEGVDWVRNQLGCSPVVKLDHQHPHVKHDSKTLNCSHFLWEDLEYRKVMKFHSDTADILFGHLPQRVGGEECSETAAELAKQMREYSLLHGIEINDHQWRFD
jgi:hypothetical protein